MADDLTTQKVIQDLQNDINFYNKTIADQAAVADPSDSQKQAEIEQLRRERDQRQIDLQNTMANANNPNVLIE